MRKRKADDRFFGSSELASIYSKDIFLSTGNHLFSFGFALLCSVIGLKRFALLSQPMQL